MGGRLAGRRPEDLGETHRALYDSLVGGRRGTGPQLFRLTDDEGRLEGPFNAFLLEPAIGDALQRLGSAIRFEGHLTDRCREIAILTVAAHWDSAFERYSHEAIGRHVGLTEAELGAIRTGDTALLQGVEQVIHDLVRDLLGQGDLADDRYDAGVAAVGESGLFEVSTLVGYYSTLALQMRMFRVGAPD